MVPLEPPNLYRTPGCDDLRNPSALQPAQKIECLVVDFMPPVECFDHFRGIPKHPAVGRPQLLGLLLVGAVPGQYDNQPVASILQRLFHRNRIRGTAIKIPPPVDLYRG